MKQMNSLDSMFWQSFKLKPETLFYNWLYIQALVKNHELSGNTRV